MAVSCTPASLEVLAACFECLTTKQQSDVQTYVLAALAQANGIVSDITPSTLLASAKCMECLTMKQQKSIQNFLLCQLVNK